MNLALRPATLRALRTFRARRSSLLHLRALLAVLGVAALTLAALALLDRARLLPDAVRPWLSLASYSAALIIGWRLAWRYLREARSDTGAAKLFESAAPELHERLLAAIELSDATNQPTVRDSAEFRERLQEEVATQVQGIRWSQVLPFSTLRPWLLRVALIALFVASLCFIPQLHFPGFLARAALPFAPLERPAAVQIRIASPNPADTLAAFVSEVEIAAEITGDIGSQQVLIEFGEPNAPTRKLEMALVQGSRFEQTLPVGQSDLRYRIHAADALTNWHLLSARPRPAIQNFVKTLTPPAYTEQPPLTLTEAHGDIEALEGSTLQLTLTSNQPLAKAALALNPTDPRPPTSPTVEHPLPDQLSSQFVITPELHSWQMQLVAAETDFTNDEAHPWRITPITDAPPTVALTEPADLLQLLPDEAVRILGLASDDVGLKSATLRHTLNASQPTTLDIPIPVGAREHGLNHLLPLGPLNLKGGDSLLVQWLVTDLKGQTAESPPIRLIIQEQTVDPKLRTWSEAQQRIASTAIQLEAQTKELKEAASRVQKNASLAKKDRPANDPEGQLARLKAALDTSKQLADDLWNQVQAAARNAPDRLATEEARLLGERLAKLRQATLPQLAASAEEPIQSTDPIRKAASDATSLADTVRKASELFAAEATAQVANLNSEHLKRQQANFTQNALDANRDSDQRPRWQEQQRAALASTQLLEKDLQALQEHSPDRGQTRSLEEVRKQLQEASTDLRDSLDTPDQKKSPEHLYGAADNLRNRLQKAADQSRAIAENAANRAAQLREQLNRQDNPALAALDEAKTALQEAAKQAADPKTRPRPHKDGLTAEERAQTKLAEAARQLQDQADLRAQSTDSPDAAAALDTNRLSRAADQLSRDTAAATSPAAQAEQKAPALAEAAQNATDLAKAARTLQAEAALQSAAQTLAQADAAALNPKADAQQLSRTAADAKAASESLRQAAEPLKRDKDTQPAAALAQQAADEARSASQQQTDQAKQTQQNSAFEPQPIEQTARAAQLAQQASEALAPQTAAARDTLEKLTPAVSDLMRQLAQDLKASQQQTQDAADQAKAEKPVAEVAEKAQELQPQTAANSQRMESLQAALRQEANQADLAQAEQRQMARSADVALEQMRQKTPQIANNLKQAAQASQSQPQALALQSAADAQQQTAQALDQLAENFAKMENGETLSADQLAAMNQMEQELGVQQALDEAYERAEALANLEEIAQENPAAALALLEQELAANATMQKALANVGRDTAHASEAQLATQANQPAFLGTAAEEAAHELQRVARHENRLNQAPAAEAVAQAAQQLQQTAEQTKTNPGNATPQMSQAATQSAQQAAQAAQTAAASTLPTPGATLADQIQAAALAQALDQLDQTLNPKAGSPGQPNQEGQQQQQQGQSGQQQQNQQSAQQSLSDAQQSQQQSMAQSRNQGQVPGSQQNQQNMAQNNQPPSQNSEQSSEGGNFQTVVKEGELAGEIIMVSGDWGRLPTSTAEGLTEATRQDAPPEYRAAIENYYKAIATKAKK